MLYWIIITKFYEMIKRNIRNVEMNLTSIDLILSLLLYEEMSLITSRITAILRIILAILPCIFESIGRPSPHRNVGN